MNRGDYMQAKNFVKKLLTLILVVIIVENGLSTSALASSLNDNELVKKVEKTANITEDAVAIKEIKSERTENSNTYLMSDGSKKLEIFSENIRYEKDGKWIDYDSSISNLTKEESLNLKEIVDYAQKYSYVNKCSDTKQYFAEKLEGNEGIVMSKDNYAFSFIPDVDQELEAHISNNKISYSCKKNNVVYEYYSLNNGIKENIVLNSKPETNEFTCILKLNNLKCTFNEKSGAVIIRDGKKEVARLARPNLIDADGNIDYKNVSYKLDGNRLTICVNQSYFEKETTKYPVIIDPSAMWTYTKMSTAVVDSMQYIADSNFHSDILEIYNDCRTRVPYVGSEERAYVNFDLEDSFTGQGDALKGKYIENATFRAYEASTNYTPATVEIRSPKSKWDTNTITWNNQPSMGEVVWGSFVCNGKTGTQHIVDLTDWAQAIADGEIENTGLVICAKNKGTGARLYGNTFNYGGTTSEGYGYSYHMYVSVIYRDIETYDGMINLSGQYNSENMRINMQLEDNSILDNGVSAIGYKIFTRVDGGEDFVAGTKGNNITDMESLDISDLGDKADIRACILYSDGSVKLTNIISFEKTTSSTSTKVKYVETIFDTDGDGLEDGYEIWDLNTLWNTETSNSTIENPEYDIDSDNDGIDDGYEVLYLGTNPTVWDDFTLDSDRDGWDDLTEIVNGTDPYLFDSDFDGLSDSIDVNPRKTDNPNIQGTNTQNAYNAQVNIGLYDYTYSKGKNGVVYTYTKSIYNGALKQAEANYGDSSLNKKIKYFYNADKKLTATIEEYDQEYDQNHSQTICKTYSYDTNGNIIYVCDRKTPYTFTYNGSNISSVKIGNQEIVNYTSQILEDNSGNIHLDYGNIIKSYQEEEIFGNGERVKTVFDYYKTRENDTTSQGFIKSFYYSNDSMYDNETYRLVYNNQGEIKNKYDYTNSVRLPIVFSYITNNGKETMCRNDGYTKISTSSESANESGVHTINKNIIYKYEGCNGNENELLYRKAINTQRNGNINNIINYDNIQIEKGADSNDRVKTQFIIDKSSNSTMMKSTDVIVNNTQKSKSVNYGTIDEQYLYTYDLAGNLVQEKLDGKVTREYIYDPHGRIKVEKSYNCKKETDYNYDDLGNMSEIVTYNLDSSGNIIKSSKSETVIKYENSSLRNQMTRYNGVSIDIDEIGNPLNSYNAHTYEWVRGRLLSKVKASNTLSFEFDYNEDGYRKSKKVYYNGNNSRTNYYEWQNGKIIREYCMNSSGSITDDKWYMYNDQDEIIGYKYTYLNGNNPVTQILYFKKDINGSVIGIVNSQGKQIGRYEYSALGNIIQSSCVTGYESLFYTNNIKYKGYYMDGEIGLYCLGSEYYDPMTGKIINVNDPEKIIEEQLNSIYNIKEVDNSYAKTSIPTDGQGYNVKYWVDENVGLCATDDMMFENMKVFNTNCYGFATNCWQYADYNMDEGVKQNLFVGITTGNFPFGFNYASPIEIATYVKGDYISWGLDANILYGSNNTPYYETDKDHLLIAVRTMKEEEFNTLGKYYKIDLYHFMIRKNGEWYFKSGYRGGIFKLKNNKTPEDIKWQQYDYDISTGLYSPKYTGMLLEDFYSSQTQYIVIPKTSIKIYEN